MEIKVKQSDLRKVNKLFNNLNRVSESEANRIIDNNGLKIVREIKRPPIPVDTGNLRSSFQSEVKPYIGIVFTNVEYAEPVAYGTSLPPSWKGQYRTRQNTIKGYPELVAKQLEVHIANKFGRL